MIAEWTLMGAVQWGLGVGIGALAVYKLVTLVFGDADLKTLSLKSVPGNAFEGRVVWITGASQGLGELLARSMFAKGALLILSARREDQLQRVANTLGDPSRVKVLPLDLTAGADEISAAVIQAEAAFGDHGVDVLVHMAGSSQRGRVEDTASVVDEALFSLNTHAPIALTKAVLPRFLSRGAGQIVLISSMAAKIFSPGQATYAAAKAAASSFHHTLHCEVADRGVDVCVMYGGPIASGSSEHPRTVYGPNGPESLPAAPEGKSRLSMERFVELVMLGTYHHVPEVWASKHPVLVLAYLSQYLPSVAGMILRKIGPARARALNDQNSSERTGTDSNIDKGYSLTSLW
eukprot:CAMPEP_0198230400 /NCGR_PEP_ID=MMETSP1445-20131203/114645_1 /TAXON_ID=36898 /ORGANISM="Pyramimonas sp., Strain CCMP2087" /LENGTH=347 /DNA_ID=CAMNT_0043910937 /DNA_START=54 /DNA_END=1094 /DNA_ORIENTATION=+